MYRSQCRCRCHSEPGRVHIMACCHPDPKTPSKILVVGDTHGSSNAVRLACEEAHAKEATAILQVGDFGFWPGSSGELFLHEVETYAAFFGLPIYAMDGNHDWHPWLREQEADETGFVPISEHLTYVPRAHRWTWAGKRLGAIGGAYSVDQHLRTEGLSWWPEEDVTDADVKRLGNDPLDVLFTHDAPTWPKNARGLGVSYVAEQASAQTRDRIMMAMRNTKPRLLVHGHWHYRYTNEIRTGPDSWCKIVGLGADGNKSSTLVLDLEGV